MTRILVVEDEAHLAEGLRFNLEAEGYSVRVSGTGEEALKILSKEKAEFAALLLDVMLPGKDGFTVARTLRAANNYIPILMLTARSRPEDVLKGFESGADDYLPKPFNLAILIARVGSLLRRKTWHSQENQPTAKSGTGIDESQETFRFGDKAFDFQNLRLQVGDKSLQLTLMEAQLLRRSHPFYCERALPELSRSPRQNLAIRLCRNLLRQFPTLSSVCRRPLYVRPQ